MNIYQIYITVVELGSFSAAAKKLHRSPSSISKKIGLLEERLNTQLFDRTTRTLSVTEAGKIYYERCKSIARQIEEAESELVGLSDQPSGSIRITWPNALSSSSIIEALNKFNQHYPDIQLDVMVDNDHVNLIDDSIDFAFRLAPAIDSNMIAIVLFDLSPVICASPRFIDQYGHPAGAEDLAEMPLLLLNNASAIQKFWKSLPGMNSLDINQYHRVNDINALLSMAREGFGATILFRHMAQPALLDGGLVELNLDHNLPSQPVYLMYHRHSFTVKKQQAFIDFFKRHYLGADLY